MAFAARLAQQLGFVEEEFITRQTRLLKALGLPTHYTGKAKISDILQHMEKDKKNSDAQNIRFVLPKAPGQLTTKQVDIDTVRRTISSFIAT